MYPINEVPKIQEVKEPYSVTRENKVSEAKLRYILADGRVRYDYSDGSAVVIYLHDNDIYELDSLGNIIKKHKISSEYDMNLLDDAISRFEGFFSVGKNK